MAKDHSLHSENLLKEMNDLISSVESVNRQDSALIEKIAAETLPENNDKINRQILDAYLQNAGRVELHVSSDEMTVLMDLIPPGDSGNHVSLEMVKEEMSQRNISGEIDSDQVMNMLIECNLKKKSFRNIILLKGKEPKNHVPRHLVFSKEILTHSEQPQGDNDVNRIDFKNISAFIIVQKDQVLGRVIDEVPGEEGINVYGKRISFRKVDLQVPKLEKNVELRDGQLYSKIEGRLVITPESVNVKEFLLVENGVNYATGHIDFPGDIVIQGEVSDGFNIKSGASIYCKNTLDASVISCKDDLTVKHGIIGRNEGIVEVGGDLKTRFIENCKVYVKGESRVMGSILNSELYCSKRLVMSKKSLVVGGVVYAQNGVITNQIGTHQSPPTEIHCGIDYIIQKKLEWIRDTNIKLTQELRRIAMVEERVNVLPLRIEEKKVKINNLLAELQESARKIVNHLDRDEESQIIINGTVFPGVYIEICHLSYIVSREMNNVRFFLDKKKGAIGWAKLS